MESVADKIALYITYCFALAKSPSYKFLLFSGTPFYIGGKGFSEDRSLFKLTVSRHYMILYSSPLPPPYFASPSTPCLCVR